jgi:chaperone modulatory protein CbpM
MTPMSDDLQGEVLDEGLSLDLAELARLCGATDQTVSLLVSEGVLRPHGGRPQEWRFSGVQVCRARRALRLQRDLELDLAATALALDLIEELESLRRRVRALEYQLGRGG